MALFTEEKLEEIKRSHTSTLSLLPGSKENQKVILQEVMNQIEKGEIRSFIIIARAAKTGEILESHSGLSQMESIGMLFAAMHEIAKK